MSEAKLPKVLLFDIGGVCVRHPSFLGVERYLYCGFLTLLCRSAISETSSFHQPRELTYSVHVHLLMLATLRSSRPSKQYSITKSVTRYRPATSISQSQRERQMEHSRRSKGERSLLTTTSTAPSRVISNGNISGKSTTAKRNRFQRTKPSPTQKYLPCPASTLNDCF